MLDKTDLYLIKQNKQIKIYSHQRYITLSYYLKFQTPMCHRQFFRVISENWENVEKFCNDMEDRFHFTCQKKISEKSS